MSFRVAFSSYLLIFSRPRSLWACSWRGIRRMEFQYRAEKSRPLGSLAERGNQEKRDSIRDYIQYRWITHAGNHVAYLPGMRNKKLVFSCVMT